MKIFNLALFLLFLSPFVFPIKDSQQKPNKNKPGHADIVFKSCDGGQRWQEASEGLPENFNENDVQQREAGGRAAGILVGPNSKGCEKQKKCLKSL